MSLQAVAVLPLPLLTFAVVMLAVVMLAVVVLAVVILPCKCNHSFALKICPA